MKENENLKKELNEKDTQNVSGGFIIPLAAIATKKIITKQIDKHLNHNSCYRCDLCNKKVKKPIATDSGRLVCLDCYEKVEKINSNSPVPKI